MLEVNDDYFAVERRLAPVFADDKCGNAVPTNYCAADMANMVTSLCFVEETLLVMRLEGELTYYLDYSALPRVGVDLVTQRGGVRELGAAMVCHGSRVFVSHTTQRADGVYVLEVLRYDVTGGDGDALTFVPFERPLYVRTSDEDGYENLSANAHNCRVVAAVADAVLVGFGDTNVGDLARDPTTHVGKLLALTHEGDATRLGAHADPYVLCVGNRNAYQMAQVPGDPRFVWGENGNERERGVLMTLFNATVPCDLAWPDQREWLTQRDPVTGSQAVLYTGADNAGVYLSVWDPASPVLANVDARGRHFLLRCYMASDPATGSEVRFRACTVETLENLNAQPQGFGVVASVLNTRANPYASSPMASAIHPRTGHFVVGDVFTGNLYAINVTDPSVFALTATNACTGAGEWVWALLAPAWFWAAIVLVCVASSVTSAILGVIAGRARGA